MYPGFLPQRNRLLALEQELQTRNWTGDRQRPDYSRRPALSAGTWAEAESITPAPSQSAKPAAPRHGQHRANSVDAIPPMTASMSPWQVLAARLNRNYSRDYDSVFPEPDLTPPEFNLDSSDSSTQRSPVPSQQDEPQGQRKPTVPLPSPAIASGQIIPHQAQKAQTRHNFLDDETSLTSWRDLATQLHQARSPQTQALQLQALPPESSTRQPGIDDQAKPASLVADQPIQIALSQRSEPSEARSIAHTTPKQSPQECLEDNRENCQRNNPVGLITTAVDSSPSTNLPREEDVTETAIVLFTPPQKGALLRHSPSDLPASPMDALIRSGP